MLSPAYQECVKLMGDLWTRLNISLSFPSVARSWDALVGSLCAPPGLLRTILQASSPQQARYFFSAAGPYEASACLAFTLSETL